MSVSCHLDGKLEGKVPSADCLVGQCTAGQASAPSNSSILLRFNRGKCSIYKPPTSGDLAARGGSHPKGISVTSGHLRLPLICGCSNSERPKGTASKRKKGKNKALGCFHEVANGGNSSRL